jgi:hypothetical protein
VRQLGRRPPSQSAAILAIAVSSISMPGPGPVGTARKPPTWPKGSQTSALAPSHDSLVCRYLYHVGALVYPALGPAEGSFQWGFQRIGLHSCDLYRAASVVEGLGESADGYRYWQDGWHGEPMAT